MIERDEAWAALAAASADLAALTSDADVAVAAATEAQAAAVAAAAAAAAAQDVLIDEQAARTSEVKTLTDSTAAAAVTASTNELTAKHALEISHAETQIATLQGQIDRMVEQLAEVKSLLPRAQQQV